MKALDTWHIFQETLSLQTGASMSPTVWPNMEQPLTYQPSHEVVVNYLLVTLKLFNPYICQLLAGKCKDPHGKDYWCHATTLPDSLFDCSTEGISIAKRSNGVVVLDSVVRVCCALWRHCAIQLSSIENSINNNNNNNNNSLLLVTISNSNYNVIVIVL